MVFGGIQKNSFIDFPGKISCVLFLSGCNFDCPYCHNPGLVKSAHRQASVVEERAIFDFLESRRTLLEGIVISGGEPTIAKDLMALCEKIKQMGYPVKLDTNGSRPEVIKRLLEAELVDYIAMDIKTDPSRYPSFIHKDARPDEILESIEIIKDRAPAYEFRTTCIRPIVDGPVIEHISRIIKGAMLYALQRVNKTEVLHPEFFEGIGSVYDEADLSHLKSLAEPWVEKCVIR